MSNNIVTALFQDSRGLLWIGTSNGLNYFDGTSFQIIFPTDFDKVHFHSDAIMHIAETVDHNILFYTADGVEEYNWQTKKLRLVFADTMNKYIYGFISDKKKNIWLLCEQCLQQYNPHYKLVRNVVLDTLKNKIGINGGYAANLCCVDNAGNIWFTYHDAVCKWNVAEQMLESRYNNVHHKKIFEMNVGSIVQDKKGIYCMLLDNKFPYSLFSLVRYNWSVDSVFEYHFETNLSGPLLLADSEKVWLNSYPFKLVQFDLLHQSFQTILDKHADTQFSNYSFLCIYTDRNKNIWLGTDGNGFEKCTDLSNNFVILNSFGYEEPKTRNTKATIADLSAFKKDLYISTTGGFFKINTENFATQSYRFNNIKHINKDYGWLNFTINDSVLLAATSQGIYQYNLSCKKLQLQPLSFKHPALLDTVPTVAEFEDSKKNIWLGMFGPNGIFCWNRQSNTFMKYDEFQTGEHYFPLRHFSCAAEDDDGNIWMGYDKNGMAVFSSAMQKFMQPSFPAFAILSNNSVHCIISDHHGRLWISTSQGVFCYTVKTHQLNQYNRVDGMSSNVAMGMAFDEKGILWIGTYSGLSRFDTATKQFINFTAVNGMPDERIYNMQYDSAIHKICFETDYAVVLFNPYTLSKNSSMLSPVITSFNVMGRQQSMSNSVHLSYKENFFSFNYTAPNFSNADDVRYEYALVGFNKSWIYAGKRQYAAYTNLDGGDYTFKLRASTDNIHWYSITTPVAIHIDTPYYKTVWFYVLSSAAVIAIIFLFIYSSYQAKLKRMVTALKIRNEIAGDLHDDIGSSLSSIMVMSEIAKKQHEPHFYFESIKQNAGQIIENMNDIVWAVNPNNDTVEQLLARMQTFAALLLEQKNIELSFEPADALTDVKLNMRERKNFYLIFKEAIHNAFKYADCKNVIVHLSPLHKQVVMQIKDDGKGFDITQKYIGNGLNNMHKRAKEINGKLNVQSNPNEGTMVMLIFKPTQKGS